MFLLDMLNPLVVIIPGVAIAGIVLALVIMIIVAIFKKIFNRR